jgi:hypothetical protein
LEQDIDSDGSATFVGVTNHPTCICMRGSIGQGEKMIGVLPSDSITTPSLVQWIFLPPYYITNTITICIDSQIKPRLKKSYKKIVVVQTEKHLWTPTRQPFTRAVVARNDKLE